MLQVRHDHLKAVVELLGGLQLALVLGLAVTQHVQVAPEGDHLVDGVC